MMVGMGFLGGFLLGQLMVKMTLSEEDTVAETVPF